MTDNLLTSILGKCKPVNELLIMQYAKGGRGRKAPYETTHARVPKEIKSLIDRITTMYRELYDQPEKITTMVSSITSILEDKEDVNKFSQVLSKEEAIKEAEKILRSKKGNKKQQFEKLLTSIYGGDINLDI